MGAVVLDARKDRLHLGSLRSSFLVSCGEGATMNTDARTAFTWMTSIANVARLRKVRIRLLSARRKYRVVRR